MKYLLKWKNLSIEDLRKNQTLEFNKNMWTVKEIMKVIVSYIEATLG